jgi:hypothetical protein
MNRDAPPDIPFPREPTDAAAPIVRPLRPSPDTPAVPSIFGLAGSRNMTLAELVVVAAANAAEPTRAVPKGASVTVIAPIGATTRNDDAATPGMAAVPDPTTASSDIANGTTGALGTPAATNPAATHSRATVNSIAVARDFARTRGTANARSAADADRPIGVSGVRALAGAGGTIDSGETSGTDEGAGGGASEGVAPVSLSDFAARRRGGHRARCR